MDWHRFGAGGFNLASPAAGPQSGTTRMRGEKRSCRCRPTRPDRSRSSLGAVPLSARSPCAFHFGFRRHVGAIRILSQFRSSRWYSKLWLGPPQGPPPRIPRIHWRCTPWASAAGSRAASAAGSAPATSPPLPYPSALPATRSCSCKVVGCACRRTAQRIPAS